MASTPRVWCPGNILIGTRHYGFVYNNGSFTTLSFAGAVDIIATGIKDRGQVIGIYDTVPFSGHHGFLYQEGKFRTIDLPDALNTVPIGINEQGDIVGVVDYLPPNGGHSFVLSNGVVTLIDFPDAQRTDALGINSEGQIVGSYLAQPNPITGSIFHGFLATPTNRRDNEVLKSPFGTP